MTTSSTPSSPRRCKSTLPTDPCRPQAVPWMCTRDSQSFAMANAKLPWAAVPLGFGAKLSSFCQSSHSCNFSR